jgi:hypothetical protein
MAKFYNPWVGAAYERGAGLLIMSESAYAWGGDDPGCPGPDHPTDNTVDYWCFERLFRDHGQEARYAASLTRALCNNKYPDLSEIQSAWNKIAYSIYVQRPMANLRERPSTADFADSHDAFLDLIEKLRPSRVIITSFTTWNNMPKRQVAPTEFWQAYRMNDDSLVWCMKVPHPAARVAGSGWQTLAWRIQSFTSRDLPMAYTPELASAKWEE